MMVVPIQSTAWGLGHWNRVLSPCGDHTQRQADVYCSCKFGTNQQALFYSMK